MKAPVTLKEALQLALLQQEQIERQQDQLQRQALELASKTAQPGKQGQLAPQKLAYLFQEGMALLSIRRSGAYRALTAGEIETYMVGRRRYVTHEALIAFRDRLQRQECSPSKPV